MVIPTETVYGLAAAAVRPAAVQALFAAKQRPADNPLIVHFADTETAVSVVPPSLGLTRRLLQHFAPGPLTVLVPAPPWIPREVTAGLDTVAVRVPAHPVAQRILHSANVPVAAPSANRSGRPSPTTAEMARAEMEGRVAAIVCGGPCAVGIESTVVDARSEREIQVLRPGMITAAQLRQVLQVPVISGGGRASMRSPGTRHAHYRPRVPVMVVPHGMVSVARRECDAAGISAAVLELAQYATAADYAAALYLRFWEAEQAQASLILAEMPRARDAAAVRDRLRRAAFRRYRPGILATFRAGNGQ